MSVASRVCPICQNISAADALFCTRCTAPLDVVALSELTDADRARCMRALCEVLATSASSGATSAEEAALFSAYLSVLWLRPETALIQFAEARGIHRLRRAGVLPEGRWLDLGCGDGIHAALYSGFRFDESFDAFQSLDLSARDIFDHFDETRFLASIVKRGEAVDFGIDIKPTAIERSKALGIFANVEKADATALPLADGSVSVVFSNMIRDLGETLAGALAEVKRVLQPGGVLIASAMTPAYQHNLFFAPRAELADRAGRIEEAHKLLKLDRGRSLFCRQQLSPDAWGELFRRQGLSLERTLPIVGGSAIRFWDVGLRPFSVPMIRQVDSWRRRGLLGEFKPAMMSVLKMAMAGLRDDVDAGETCMHLLVARKPL